MSDLQTKRSSEKRVRGGLFAWFARRALVTVVLLAASACDRTARSDVRHEEPIQTPVP